MLEISNQLTQNFGVVKMWFGIILSDGTLSVRLLPSRRLHVLTLVYFITIPVVLDIPTCSLDVCTAPSLSR